MKKYFVFIKKEVPKDVQTNWIMEEYHLSQSIHTQNEQAVSYSTHFFFLMDRTFLVHTLKVSLDTDVITCYRSNLMNIMCFVRI